MTPEMQKMCDELWAAKMERARREIDARRKADLAKDMWALDRAIAKYPR